MGVVPECAAHSQQRTVDGRSLEPGEDKKRRNPEKLKEVPDIPLTPPLETLPDDGTYQDLNLSGSRMTSSTASSPGDLGERMNGMVGNGVET